MLDSRYKNRIRAAYFEYFRKDQRGYYRFMPDWLKTEVRELGGIERWVAFREGLPSTKASLEELQRIRAERASRARKGERAKHKAVRDRPPVSPQAEPSLARRDSAIVASQNVSGIREELVGYAQFLRANDLPASIPAVVAICGSGPYSEEEFASFLEEVGVHQERLSPESSWLVIGREDWSPAQLREVLSKRRGMGLGVYSQEMFISHLMSGCNPFDETREALHSFAHSHSALEWLRNEWFDWPTTEITDETSGGIAADWPKQGMLAALAYRVGRHAGLEPEARRKRLRTAFETADLPRVGSPRYREEWGAAGSSARLKKIADSIASFCRNAKRKSSDYSQAVEEWEDDLQWLRSEYYEGRYGFAWPNTWVE